MRPVHVLVASMLLVVAGLMTVDRAVAVATSPTSIVPSDVTFKARDGVVIYAQYYRAASPRALIVLFHQAHSSKAEYTTIAPRLAAAGYSALAVDQRSGGNLYGTNQTVAALGHSADYLDAKPDIWIDLSIIRSLRMRLRTASDVASRIARGAIGVPIDTGRNDEVGLLLGALSQMDTQLESVVEQVRKRASMVEHSAAIIAKGNEALSQRTQIQAIHLQGTAASMARMSAAISQSVRHADQAHEAVNDVETQTMEGRRTVIEANTAMAEINRTGKRMEEVLDLVDQVAFQTHMLALNAAVEAAQAGMHGRGFGVIATEMRQLAHRCGQAARDIRQMIRASDDATRAGSVLVDRTGVVLEAVADGVSKLAALIAAMASTERGHAKEINVVNDSVVDMESMTGQNATLVEEAAIASRVMQENASELLQEVDFFHMQNDQKQTPDIVADQLKNKEADHSENSVDLLPDHLNA